MVASASMQYQEQAQPGHRYELEQHRQHHHQQHQRPGTFLTSRSILDDVDEEDKDHNSEDRDDSSDFSADSSMKYDATSSMGESNGALFPGQSPAPEDEPELATYETRQVGWLRIFVFASLLTAAIGVSAAIYYSTREAERDEFELRFADHSNTILEAVRTHMAEGIAAVDNMAVAILSHAKATNATWPRVTIPDFERRAAATRKSGIFTSIAFLPYVQESERSSYEAYVVQNYGWMDDGLKFENRTRQDQWNFAVHDDDSNNRRLLDASSVANSVGARVGARDVGEAISSHQHRPNQQRSQHSNRNHNHHQSRQQQHEHDQQLTQRSLQSPSGGTPQFVISNSIWTSNGTSNARTVPEGTGPYLPVWQHSPVDVLVNFDVLNGPELAEDHRTTVESNQLTLSKVVILESNVPNSLELFAGLPSSSIIYPLNEIDSNGKLQRFLGIVSTNFAWDSYMQLRQLPQAANDIQIILQNQCGQAFTFQVVDGDVTYFQAGDHHDGAFDIMARSFDLDVFFQEETIGVGDITFNEDRCPSSLHIYPTNTMRDRYFSNLPAIYTVLVAVAFVVTSAIFLGYDCIVERRQKVVMKTATKSHAIVSSLFPKNVRKRLLDDGNADPNAAANGAQESVFNTDQITIGPFATQRAKLKSFVNSVGADYGMQSAAPENPLQSKPIADLFPKATVLFADIAGFTAWSSTREPSQVFRLLESIYGAFDKLADRKGVFKVETIGDSYLAVTGLPDPQPEHALIMAKFAAAALHKMAQITRDLEVELGPDTTDLAMRIGLHSGPVTAGVLRGQKSRFQLFGDTVNTASRMESTGVPNRIQCSQETANLLVDHGKSQWIRTREDLIEAKGKGTIQTFWVMPRVGGTHSVASVESAPVSMHTRSQFAEERQTSTKLNKRGPRLTPHFQRLVEWNVDLLMVLLKRVVAHQMNSKEQRKRRSKISIGGGGRRKAASQEEYDFGCGNPREEYREAIHLPHFQDNVAIQAVIDPNDIQLKPKVEAQLRDYVTKIASSYRDNPFHNYDHASHVTMSTNKILMRIVAADDLNIGHRESNAQVAAQLHNYTYGITSDPLTHFACVFAALIHDVDHPGVPNSQLIKEKDEMAQMYGGKSVAEQNSLDLAWGLLMDLQYKELRACLFEDQDSKKRFRQLLVNIVMATDIFDPELKKLRNNRWSKAFPESMSTSEHGNLGKSESTSATALSITNPANEQNGNNDSNNTASNAMIQSSKGSSRSNNGAQEGRTSLDNLNLAKMQSSGDETESDNLSTTTSTTPEDSVSNRMDLKATIVIEHILQAADVSHTMQHWHVYQKWNRRLFNEMYRAFKDGRLDKDPSLGWYRGELWFYDNYIIPLAKKLSECGVFGVSSDEFINYAMMNRSEWESKGEHIVKMLKQEYESANPPS